LTYEPKTYLPVSGGTKSLSKKGGLNEQQEKFVDLLFKHDGDSKLAIQAHDHYSNESRSWLMRHCSDAIVERTKRLIAAQTVQAAAKVSEVLTLGDDPSKPPSPYIKMQMKAAESILDRAGVQAAIKIEADVRTITGVVYLPDKSPEKDVEIIDG